MNNRKPIQPTHSQFIGVAACLIAIMSLAPEFANAQSTHAPSAHAQTNQAGSDSSSIASIALLCDETKSILEQSRSTIIVLKSKIRSATEVNQAVKQQDGSIADLKKLTELISEALSSSNGEIVRNGKSISIAKLRSLTETTMRKVKDAESKNQARTLVDKKLNTMSASLKSTFDRTKQIMLEAERTLTQLKTELAAASHQLETEQLAGQRYLEKGLALDLAVGSESPIQSDRSVELAASPPTANSTLKLKAMVTEFRQMADQLEADGKPGAANTLREKANRMSTHLNNQVSEAK